MTHLQINKKPKKYTIIHKESNEIIDIEEVVEEIKESSSTIIEYFSPDDTSDVIAKDIIVGETNIDNQLENYCIILPSYPDLLEKDIIYIFLINYEY